MKKTEAYFTVEAALVMPVVFGVILFVIYMFFFLYDRCLMEQNAQVLAMRGCTLQITDRNELAEELLAESQREDLERYLAFETEKATISLQGDRVSVQKAGVLKFPFRGLSPGGTERWETETSCVNHRIAPVKFVRNCRKIMGGK